MTSIYPSDSSPLEFSKELIQLCTKLQDKKRLFWTNFANLGVDEEIGKIKDHLQLTSPKQMVFHVIENKTQRPVCVCGNLTSWGSRQWLQYCSSKCSVAHTKESREQTMLERYGDRNIARTGHFKQKSIESFLCKYGVTNPSKSPIIQSKKLETNREKYGVDNYSQFHLTDIAKQIIADKQDFKNFASGKTIASVARELGLSYSGPIKIAQRFGLDNLFIPASRSDYEVQIKELLDNLGIPYVQNTKKIIPPWQLDFYLPTMNLAIEVGSLYYHCEMSSKRGKNYHFNKWEQCQKKGITLLQYFDDDIINKFSLISSKIKRLCGIKSPVIGARKIQVVSDIDSDLERDFLNQYHLQGANLNRNCTYSGYYKEQLVGILSIKHNREQAEIIRYATNIDYSYPGLFSKLLNQFIYQKQFTGVIKSFSDNRHSNGTLYKSAGFALHHTSSPGYSYTKNFIVRENRLLFQKHKLASKFSLTSEYIESKTAWQIMHEQGYDRIWDAGQSLWVKIIGPQGGTTMKGSDLIATAKEEIEKLDQEILQYIDNGTPSSFVILG